MGNNICGVDDGKKQSLQPESKIVLTKIVDNTTIQIIQADIVEELSDVIVNASHEPSDSYISKRDRNPKVRDKLINMKIGEIVITETENVNALEIYNVRLPLYQDPRDLLKIFNCYSQCLQQTGHKVISFTEQSTPNFAVPRQYIAEVLIRAILTAAKDNQLNFEQIKFVSLDQLTLKYFAYELVKQLDELKIPELLQNRIETFMQFITTNEDIKQEVYMLSTGLTSDQDPQQQ